MNATTRITALARGLAAAGVLALAGCGGSSSPPLSPAQLSAKVNAACAAYANAVLGFPQPGSFATNPTAAAGYLDKLKPLVSQEYSRISALNAPSAVKADFNTYLHDGARQLSLFEDALASARAHNTKYLHDLRAAAKYKDRALATLDQKLGFTSCLS